MQAKWQAIRAVLFDADGVVVFPSRFADYLEHELQITRSATQDFFSGAFLDCLVGRADLKEQIAPFLPRWGWTGSVETFLQCWFEKENAVDLRMIETIGSLRRKGFRCYLATNQERHRIEYMKRAMSFATIFDDIFSSAEIGAKHQPIYFERVTERLGLPRDAILFWDDSRENVETARAYSWNAEHYETFEAFQDTLRKYLTPDLFANDGV